MENDSKETVLIEKYLDGSLTESELESFMQRMESDPEFKKEVEIEKNLRLVLQEKDVMDFRGELKEINALLKQEEYGKNNGVSEEIMVEPSTRSKPTPFFSQRNLLLAAASVAVLGALTFLLFRIAASPTYTNDKLFSAFYQTYPVDHIKRSGMTPMIKEDSAMMFYSTGEFIVSAVMFGQLAGISPQNAAYSFYHAISLIETGEFERSKAILENLANTRENEFYEQSLWYLALAQLKSGEISQAQSLLISIRDNRYFNHEQVQKLMKKMKKLR